MSFYNIKNPDSKLGENWIFVPEIQKKIDSENTVIKRTVTEDVKKDIGDLFSIIKENEISASIIQSELIKLGVTIESDPEINPNGVTVTSSGIFIATPTSSKSVDEEIKIKSVLKDIVENPSKFKAKETKGGGGKLNEKKEVINDIRYEV